MAGNNRSEEQKNMEKTGRRPYANKEPKMIESPTAGNNRSLNSTNDVKCL